MSAACARPGCTRPATRSWCSTTCPPATPTPCPTVAGSSRPTWPSRGELLAEGFDGVLHFAAKSLVGRVDAGSGQVLVGQRAHLSSVCSRRSRAHGTPRLVFSSTAAVYGEPEQVPIPETAPTRPDQHLRRDQARHRPRHHLLRHRPRAGRREPAVLQRRRRVRRATASGTRIETHLIPLVLQVALGQRDGDPRLRRGLPDRRRHLRPRLHPRRRPGRGAPARARARHARATHRIYNLGSGTGFSVREVVETCREVTGHPIPAEIKDRRPGDPPALVASSDRGQGRARAGSPSRWTWRSSSVTRGSSPGPAPVSRRRQERGEGIHGNGAPGRRAGCDAQRVSCLLTSVALALSGAVPCRDLPRDQPPRPQRTLADGRCLCAGNWPQAWVARRTHDPAPLESPSQALLTWARRLTSEAGRRSCPPCRGLRAGARNMVGIRSLVFPVVSGFECCLVDLLCRGSSGSSARFRAR